MKKIIALIILAGSVIVSCSPKTAPSTSAPSGEIAFRAADIVSTSATDIEAGKTIFTTKCAKCHGPKDNYVANHTFDESVGVMNSMSKKASLTQQEVDQLAAYVKANAKQ
ncbi:MAG: c-type cytochrome [Niabella sp.]